MGTRELPPPEDADAWAGGRGRCSGSVRCRGYREHGRGWEGVSLELEPCSLPHGPLGTLGPSWEGLWWGWCRCEPWSVAAWGRVGGPCPSPVKSRTLGYGTCQQSPHRPLLDRDLRLEDRSRGSVTQAVVRTLNRIRCRVSRTSDVPARAEHFCVPQPLLEAPLSPSLSDGEESMAKVTQLGRGGAGA